MLDNITDDIALDWLVSRLPAFRAFARKFPNPKPKKQAPIQRESGITFIIAVINTPPQNPIKILTIVNNFSWTNPANKIEIQLHTNIDTEYTVIKLLASLVVQPRARIVKDIPKAPNVSSIAEPRNAMKQRMKDAAKKKPLLCPCNWDICKDGDCVLPSWLSSRWLNLQPEWIQLRICATAPTTHNAPRI